MIISFAKTLFFRSIAPKSKVNTEVEKSIVEIDTILETIPKDTVVELVNIISGNKISEKDRETYKQVLDTTFSIATLVKKLAK
jgi:hypothetical protein